MVAHRGIVKVIIVVILAVLVAASFLFMTQEQRARGLAEDTVDQLGQIIDEQKQLGPEEVHQAIGCEPTNVRQPNRKRLIEEYTWKGPFSEHTVYAYYEVAATQILEATSLNKKMDDWER